MCVHSSALKIVIKVIATSSSPRLLQEANEAICFTRKKTTLNMFFGLSTVCNCYFVLIFSLLSIRHSEDNNKYLH